MEGRETRVVWLLVGGLVLLFVMINVIMYACCVVAKEADKLIEEFND